MPFADRPMSKDMSVRECLLQDDFVRKLDLKNYVQSRYDESIAQVPVLSGESTESRHLLANPRGRTMDNHQIFHRRTRL